MVAWRCEELREVLQDEHGFGHRAHVHLAWRYLRRNGPIAAEEQMRWAIREVATAHGTPEKYHETLTTTWVRLVGVHVQRSSDADFASFIANNEALLDPSLPGRHFSPEVLQSTEARRAFVEPDLAPLPR